MRVFETRFEAEDFLSKYNLNYSEYSPILERKDRKFIVFEKGDIIIFNNKKYIYYGYEPDKTKLPCGINAFYKDGPFIRAITYNNCTDEMVNEEFRRLDKLHKEEIFESMKKLDKSVLQLLNSSGSKNTANEVYKKKREDEIRRQGISMLGGKCCVCGSVKDLSFVHRDAREKIAPVSRMIKENRNKEDILTEMLKCDLYCEKCRQLFFAKLQRIKYLNGILKKEDYLKYKKK